MNKYIFLSILFSFNSYSMMGSMQLQSSTIQKEWIDTGYFEWRTKENSADIWFENIVALKITHLGMQQEYLPNVTDGEQLNSVQKMFEGDRNFENGIKLKKAPHFNVSNVKDFSYMFENCFSLDSIPTYNTQNGVNFHGMFYNCHSLHSVPKLNTSNGTDFGSMFFKTSIKSIPKLDTSKGEDFSFMFADCFNLDSITSLNTSKGNNFHMIFQGCNSLKSVRLDVSSSAHFWIMFGACYSLEDVKLIGLGRGKPTLPKYDFLYEKNDIELPEDITIESIKYIIDNGENLHSKIFYIKLDKKLEFQIPPSLIEEVENKNFALMFR